MERFVATVLTALLLAASPAMAAELAADTLDISAARPHMRLLTDGKKHYLVVVPFWDGEPQQYYGDGKSFYSLRTRTHGGEGKTRFYFTFWDPRITYGWQKSFDYHNGKYIIFCGDGKTELQPVAKEEADNILDSATFYKPLWKWKDYRLARDDEGTYFYVDKAREPEGNKQFRVFKGPKGNMKQLKMSNVVSDSEGDIFVTKSGELRFVLDKKEQLWVAGKSRTKLTTIPTDDNLPLIYGELGAYTGQRLGSPCDDL